MYEAGSVAVLLGGRLNPTGFLEWGKRVAAAKAEKGHEVVLGARNEASGPIGRFIESITGARRATLDLQATVTESMGGVGKSTTEASAAVDRDMSTMSNSVKRTADTVLGLGDSYKETATVVRDETTRMDEATQQFGGEHKKVTDTYLRQNEEMQASAKQTARVMRDEAGMGAGGGGRTPGATTALGGAGGAAEQQAKRTTGAWKEGFNTLANVGKWATASILGIGAISVKWAADFQRQMTILQTQAGATDKEMKILRQGILNLAPATGFGPAELAKGLYHIESAGFHGKHALDILKLAAEGAKVGMANLEDTSSALAAIMKSSPKDIHSVGEAMGVMNDIVGRGNMHMEDLNKALGTGIVAAAKAAHLGLRDVGAALDVMTSRGVPAEQAATRLRTTLTLMSSPTAKAQKALEQLGMSQSQLATDMKQHGLSYALDDLQHHLDKAFPPGRKLTIDEERSALMKYGQQLQDSGVKGGALQKDLIAFKQRLKETGGAAIQQSQLITEAFGGSRMGTTMAMLMQNADDVKKHFNQLNQAGAAQRFNKDWQKTQKDFSVQVSEVWAGIKELGIRIGDFLIPKIKALVSALVDAARWLGHHKVLLTALEVLFGTILVAAIAAFFARLGAGIYGGLKDIASFGKAIGGLPGKFADAAKRIAEKLGLIRSETQKTTTAVDELGTAEGATGAEGAAGGAAGAHGGTVAGEAAAIGGAVEGMITGVRGKLAPGSSENPLAVVVMASEMYGLGARGAAAEEKTATGVSGELQSTTAKTAPEAARPSPQQMMLPGMGPTTSSEAATQEIQRAAETPGAVAATAPEAAAAMEGSSRLGGLGGAVGGAGVIGGMGAMALGGVVGGGAGKALTGIGGGVAMGAGLGMMLGPAGAAGGAAIGGIVGALTSIPGATKAVSGAFSDMWKFISSNLGITTKGVKQFVHDVGNFFTKDLLPVFNSVWHGVRTALSGVLEVFKGVIDFFKGVFSGNWSEIWKGIKEIFGGFVKFIEGLVGAWLSVFKGVVSFLGGVFLAGIKGAWKLIKEAFNAEVHLIKNIVSALPGIIEWPFKEGWKLARGVLNGAKDLIKTDIGAIVSVAKGAWDVITHIIPDAISSAFTTALHFVERLPSKFESAAGTLGSAMVKGLGSLGGDVLGVFKSVINDGIIGPLNWVIGKIDAISIDLPSIGPIGGGHIGFHIGKIQPLQTGGFVGGTNPYADSTLVAGSAGELMVTAHGQQMMDAAAPGLVNHVVQNQLPHPQTNSSTLVPRGTSNDLSSVGKAGADTGKGLNTATGAATALSRSLLGLSSNSKKAHDDLSKNLKDATTTTDKELKKNHDTTNTRLSDTFKIHKSFGQNVTKNLYTTFVKGGSGQSEAMEPMMKDAWDNVKKTTQTYTSDVQNIYKKSNSAIISDANTFSGNLSGAHKNMAHSVATADAKLAESSAGIMAKMDTATYSGVKAVFDEMNKALSQLSVKGITFAGNTNPGAAATSAIGGVEGLIPYAGGGHLPGSEYGLGDVMTLVDPHGNPRAKMAGDEGIFNRHQMPWVDLGLQMLGFSRGSEDLWNTVNTPHAYANGGRLPGFQTGGTPAGGFWVQTGATIDPTMGQAPTYDAHGGFSFAELLEAGANAGMRPDLTQLLGLPRGSYGMPMETPIDIRMPGSPKSFQIWKNDVGSGQSGNPHYTIDLHQAIASALGWSPNGDVQVAKAGTDPHASVVAGAGTATWTALKPPKWTGPGGVGGTIGEAVLKKVADAANKYGQAHMPVLSSAPGSWGGGVVPGIASKPSGYFFPFPKGMSFSWQRIDQGQDMEEAPGGPVLAIAPGVVSVASDRFSGFGPYYATEQITAGPLAGRGVYYGHTKAVKTGPVNAGDVIAVTQSSANSWTAAPAGWLELGFLPYGSMTAGGAMAPVLHAIYGGAYAKGGRLGESAAQPRRMLGDPPSPLRNALRQIVKTGYSAEDLHRKGQKFASGGLLNFALGGRPWSSSFSGAGYVPGYRPVRVRRGRTGLHVIGAGGSGGRGSSSSSHSKSGSGSSVKSRTPARRRQPISQNTANVLNSVGLGNFVSSQNELGQLDNQYTMQESLFNMFDGSGGSGLPLQDLDVLMGIREQEWDILYGEWKKLPHAIAVLSGRVEALQGHKAGWHPYKHENRAEKYNDLRKLLNRRPGQSMASLHLGEYYSGNTGVAGTTNEIAGMESSITNLEKEIKDTSRAITTVHHNVSSGVMSLADNYANATSGLLQNLIAITDEKYALTQERIGLRNQSLSISSGGSAVPSLSLIVGQVMSGVSAPSVSSGNSAAKRAISRKINNLSGREAALTHASSQIRQQLAALNRQRQADARRLRQQGFDQAWALTQKKWGLQDQLTYLKQRLTQLKALLKEENTQLKSESSALTQMQGWLTGGLQGDSSMLQSLANVGMEILGLYQQGADLPTPGRKEPTLKGIENILSAKPPKGLGLTIPSGLIHGVQTATQAYTDFTAFQGSRQSLFSQFGSNFVPAGANAFAGAAGAGAGVQYYGAAAGSSGGPGAPTGFATGGRMAVDQRGGDTNINIENNFGSGPPDAHTWAAGTAFEIAAAA